MFGTRVVALLMLLQLCWGNRAHHMLQRNIICNRRPDNTQAEKVSGDNGYKIKISGNPEKYQPGVTYAVGIHGWRTNYSVQKFTGFMLMVDRVSSAYSEFYGGPMSVGTLQLRGDVLMMHSNECPNAVVHTSISPKSEIQVYWTAPPAGSGCVRFRGMVQESRDTWYMDDGDLTKEICEEPPDFPDVITEAIDDCCACDEAKYEVTFEGLWSRQTHPKDFPDNEWLIHFSDIIGASHSNSYKVWQVGATASDGLRQVAETGATRTLESELKRNSDHIRTIIKARGLWQPNVNGKTFAVFRVDNRHHLMSLVSMLGPSPDWIVGVPALELCLKNCSWLQEKTINLYPYDAGTDSGVTYMSVDQATIPRSPITKITNNFPNDERSPFYDPRGYPMNPLARLTISRQRVYKKTCTQLSPYDHVEGHRLHYSDEDAERPECATSQWSEFTACSVTCGQGLRMRSRSYAMPLKADINNCRRQLEEKEMCTASIPFCHGGGLDSFFPPSNYFDNNAMCAMSSWSPWNPCSVTCGPGVIMRVRHYLDQMGRKKCNEETTQKEPCPGIQRKCPEEQEAENLDPACTVTQWSEWSPCSTTCGVGHQTRTRIYLVPSDNKDHCNVQTTSTRQCHGIRQDCSIDPSEAHEVCTIEKDIGPCRGKYQRWYYDIEQQMCMEFMYGGCRGNRNNFVKHGDCRRLCEQNSNQFNLPPPTPQSSDLHYWPNHYESSQANRRNAYEYSSLTSGSPIVLGESRVNCVMGEWSNWTPCSTSCGRGKRERRRQVLVEPQNGGRPCHHKLVRVKICRNRRCPAPLPHNGLESHSLTREEHYLKQQQTTTVDPQVEFDLEYDGSTDSDCEMGDWSAWNPCTQSCGPEALQQRARSIISIPRGNGAPCGPRLERRYCTLPPCLHNRG